MWINPASAMKIAAIVQNPINKADAIVVKNWSYNEITNFGISNYNQSALGLWQEVQHGSHGEKSGHFHRYIFVIMHGHCSPKEKRGKWIISSE